MADPWKTILEELPTNGQLVWIRITNVYGQLVKATYNSSMQQFTTQDTSVIIPAYQVARWKDTP